MIEKNKEIQEVMLNKELSEISGGKRKIDEYNFTDIETMRQKAYIEVEKGKVVKAVGIDRLNERDIEAIPDNIKRQVGL